MAIESTFNQLSCSTDEISAYIDGELDLVRELEMDAHFAICEACSLELNQQKQFLRNLDASLRHAPEMELPANFTKQIVANAESTVSGLRRPRERFNALFICAGLMLFVLFATGAEAGKLFQGIAVILEQTVAVAVFLGHLVYSVFVGIAIIVRNLAGPFQLSVLTILAAAMALAGFSFFVSRKVLRMSRV